MIVKTTIVELSVYKRRRVDEMGNEFREKISDYLSECVEEELWFIAGMVSGEMLRRNIKFKISTDSDS